MDYIWSPWRYSYLTGDQKPKGCIFCAMAADRTHDQDWLIVFRGVHNFVVLNRYPYTSGHLMIVPHTHSSELSAITEAAAAELMELTRTAEKKLRALYRPDGLNIGMNLGASAGAGIAGHIHMHVVPRWTGDANFMTITAETRVLPEELGTTWQRVQAAFAG